MFGERPNQMSGLQKIADPATHDESDLDPILSQRRRVERGGVALGKPTGPSLQLPGVWQYPASVVRANCVGTGRIFRRPGFQMREKPLGLIANITLRCLGQVGDLRLSDRLAGSMIC